MSAKDLSTELAALADAVNANAEATNALAPAIQRELQQVVDAFNSGGDARAALEAARNKISDATSGLQANASALQRAIADLGSDDAPAEPAPAPVVEPVTEPLPEVPPAEETPAEG